MGEKSANIIGRKEEMTLSLFERKENVGRGNSFCAKIASPKNLQFRNHNDHMLHYDDNE